MLLTPQHRRSSRVSRRAATKTAQQIFDEKIASGTMTKEELERTPTSLRHFDEAEDAILGLLDEESDEESDDEGEEEEEDAEHSNRAAESRLRARLSARC